MVCSANHETINCSIKVNKILPCGHSQTMDCSKSFSPAYCAIKIDKCGKEELLMSTLHSDIKETEVAIYDGRQ